ncbi:TerD family protein [Streptomyces xiamenensis]|uniref:TerD family protein n=1 Tax=Streptomyces xiamenensis TaxID=408015 RepID=UPI0037D78C57
MHTMVKGANVSLAALSEHTGSVIVSLGWTSQGGDGDADVCVLLVDADGKVRGDDDFYFYNNPVAPDGSVHLLGKTAGTEGSEDRIGFDLTALPAAVDRIVVAASRDGAAGFDELDDLRVTLSDAAGDRLLRFAPEGTEAVSALVFGELYRRGTDWKFRAVGQGYASGLAGLATDFGVDIEDDAVDAVDAASADEDGGTGTAAAEEGNLPDTGGAEPAPVDAPVTSPGSEQPSAAGSAAPSVPAQRGGPPPAGEEPAARPRRPRTAKKKITLPRISRKSLAENESWKDARIFPVSALRSDRERENRATSVLLSVMAQVPEFGRRLIAGFGAPAGRMETFTEVSLPHGDTPRRPDGVIRVERAGKLWTALVETKTNGNDLKAEQVQAYMDIAARRGYEAVITLSNDVALEGTPLLDVRVDGRRKHKVALWHLPWAEVTYQAQTLIRHEGVGNPAHAWLLQELLHYLQHDNSGCHGFQNMGASWVPVRNGIEDETLSQGDPRALEVVESWERLIRQVCLGLGGELGLRVLPVQRARRGGDHGVRRARSADRLCAEGRLHADIKIENGPGVLAITADLRTGKLRTSVEIPAPEQGYPLTWAKRLIRRLAEAPADLHIETLVEGEGGGPRGTLERLRPEPADLLPRAAGTRITGFRLSLFKGMGSGRGNAESGFIRSVDDAVHRFHSSVVLHLDGPPARRSSPRETPGAA